MKPEIQGLRENAAWKSRLMDSRQPNRVSTDEVVQHDLRLGRAGLVLDCLDGQKMGESSQGVVGGCGGMTFGNGYGYGNE